MAEETTQGYELGELAIRQLQELIRQRKFGDGDQDMRPRHQKRKLMPWLDYIGAFEFTLTQNLSGGAATATLTNYWGAKPEVSDTVGDTEIVIVTDTQECFKRGLIGAQGFALVDIKRSLNVVIECHSKAGWIRGTLTADISAGSSSGATVTEYGGSQQDIQSPGSTVTVYDPQSLFTRALSGAKFKASYEAVSDKYNLVECETKAGWVEFTLTADMSGGSSSAATVNDYGGSQQDVQSPGSTVTIYDPHTIFKYALNGAKGYAVYDAVEDKYTAVTCQQRSMWVSGTLPSALASTDADKSVGTGNYSPTDHSPFNQDPGATLTIKNRFDMEGDNGAPFLARWDEDAAEWFFVQVQCPA